MQKTRLNILSTRPLSETILKEAAERNVSIDCISFIETEPVKTPELKNKLEQLSSDNLHVVFTSMNAVESVKEYLPINPNWKIFSMGQTTRELIRDFFGEQNISGTADDAGKLADVIIEQHPQKLIFFCGDQRRDELPEKLAEKNIPIEEIVVYRTKLTSQKIAKEYDGILFFSPSAVDSFFSMNSVGNNTIVFAIGNTTANAINEKVNNKIIIADKPGKEALVKRMLAYFSPEKQGIND